MRHLPGWVGICSALIILALFFMFAMRGYDYISYTLLFAAFLVAVFNIGPLWLRRVVAVVTAIGMCYFCFVEFLIIREAGTDKNAGRSHIIVLGAAVHGTVPSLALTHRLQSTLAYLEKYPNAVAIVSGGQGEGEDISEAECMRAWLINRGIAPERVIPEDKSTSTMENLMFSKEIILSRGGSLDDVAILSSCYHLYRAKSMARGLGMEVAGVRGVFGYPIYTLGMFIREAFGVTHLWVFGE